MDKFIFRWIENLKGDCYPVKSLASMPNHDKLRMIEEHQLTDAQAKLDLNGLAKAFPKPTRVRVLN
jgi:thiamine biosynthesis lipoprotein ApbE